MSSVVRSVLGAALLLTGASAAMAQSANLPVAYQAPQTTAPANVPASTAPVPAPAATTVVAANTAPAEGEPKKFHTPRLCDRADAYGGHGNESHWGIRAFWELRADGS